MNIGASDLKELCALAIEAAVQSGDYIQTMVGKHQGARRKDVGDSLASRVVTEVDVESQRRILGVLGKSIDAYDLGFLTEESADDLSRLQKDYFWCVDPLDGTLPFVEGRPGYAVSIALVSREGEPLIGVVRDPASGVTFHAFRGGGVFKDSVKISGQASEGRQGELVWIMDRSMKESELYSALADAMKTLAETRGHSGLSIVDYAGAALNATWVLLKPAAVYFKFPKPSKGGGSVWDFAATSCLFREWGAPSTDIFGDPLKLNQSKTTFMNEHGVVYASRPDLAESVRSIYRKLLA
jgi:myo-inositol-1(or 4)-monophosphatase